MSEISNTDQPAFHMWRWQITHNFGLPAESATEKLWLDVSEETRQSFRHAATGIRLVLNHLECKVAEAEIDSGSEHFQHGQETMQSRVQTMIRDARDEIYGDVDWSTP